jgi:two-component system, cell cycle sensor histidine kinase and response regulator CckA
MADGRTSGGRFLLIFPAFLLVIPAILWTGHSIWGSSQDPTALLAECAALELAALAAGAALYKGARAGMAAPAVGIALAAQGLQDRMSCSGLVPNGLRKAADTSHEVIFLTDPQGLIRWVNPQFTSLYGYDAKDVVGIHTPRILKSGLPKSLDIDGFWRRIKAGEKVEMDWINKTRDGRLVTVEGPVGTVHDETGAVLGYIAIQQDTSTRKSTEAALKETEELYQKLVDISPDAIVLVTLAGNIRLCTQRMAAVSGFEKISDLMGLNAFSLIANKYRRDARKLAVKTLRSQDVCSAEFAFRRKDGSEYPADLSLAAYVDDLGRPKGFVGTIRDLTARRKLEMQLLQAQRMEAVGKLAGGVAHDFNNLLTAIIGYSDLMLSDPQVTATQNEDIRSIKKACDKAGNLVRQLLAFSRRQVMQPAKINLNIMVNDLSKMLRRLIGETVELSTTLDPDLGYAKADPAQMEQVLLNLAVNSRDAMPRGGRLRIETRNVEVVDSSSLQPSGTAPGRYVRITVEDTGAGMDETTVSHVFEPFFSTKEPGKGSGLGLSAVYGIVCQSGGAIEIASRLGSGTAVHIYLPRVEKEREHPEYAGAGQAFGRGSETVLVAEDEENVRNVICSLLQAKGYRILEARDGIEALEIARKYPHDIHVIITDLVMPRMGGVQLISQLRQDGREFKTMYTSGYSDQPGLEEEMNRAGTLFLQKPFSTDDLAHQVRALIDGKAD